MLLNRRTSAGLRGTRTMLLECHAAPLSWIKLPLLACFAEVTDAAVYALSFIPFYIYRHETDYIINTNGVSTNMLVLWCVYV